MSAVAVDALEDEKYNIALSAASIWEIAIKRSLGKLAISDGWATSLSRLDFDPMPVTRLMHGGRVPAAAPSRSVRHLLVAQSSVEGCTLVSADDRLGAYDVEVLW
jgi:PIN domain nuclease of toxin-antitoxin system